MSYHIYTTKGLVLSARSLGEADRIYSILTDDLGLIRATALGVRKEHSKLRGSLEPLVLSRISLVRGKEFWRLTSAEVIERIETTPDIVRPLALLEKLVPGESAHPELFEIVENTLVNEKREGEMFEIRFVAQILYHLGYVKEKDLTGEKQELIKAINTGLQASHLV